MEKYSQNHEQDIILEHFKDESGTFLDIGAYTGKELSNTHALALSGWKGLCVEPSDGVFPALKKLYADNENIECFQTCIGDYNGEITFYESGGDAVSTTVTEEMSKWVPSGVKYEKRICPIITIAELLKKSKYKQFDFISIDTEGTNFEILQQINPIELGVKMLCIEWNGKDKDKYEDYMLGFGFHIVHVNGENLIFIK